MFRKLAQGQGSRGDSQLFQESGETGSSQFLSDLKVGAWKMQMMRNNRFFRVMKWQGRIGAKNLITEE